MKEKCSDKFVPDFWKIEHNSGLARWIVLTILNPGVKAMRIEILKARGLGKICSSRTRYAKVSEMHQIFGLQMRMLTLS